MVCKGLQQIFIQDTMESKKSMLFICFLHKQKMNTNTFRFSILSRSGKDLNSKILTCLVYFVDEEGFGEWEGGGSHLNTQCNNISKSGEWLGWVQPTQGWVNHFSQSVYVMELWGGPSYKALFRSWFWTKNKKRATTLQLQMQGLHKWKNKSTMHACNLPVQRHPPCQ